MSTHFPPRSAACGILVAAAVVAGAGAAHGQVVFVEETDLANPFHSVFGANAANITLADLDADGDLDAVAGNFDGTFNLRKNVATPTFARYWEIDGPGDPFAGIDVGIMPMPALVDIDADGDADLFAGNYAGEIRYFENVGSPALASFLERTGAENPFPGGVPRESNPTFADIDADGDFDAFVGAFAGDVHYFENVGSAAAPAFLERFGAFNPLDAVHMMYRAAPAFTDVDGDGDLDVFVGGTAEPLHYFENVGSPMAAQFVERFGSANPLGHVKFRYPFSLKIEFADLDGDGDGDAVLAEDFTYSPRFFRNGPVFDLSLSNGEALPVQVLPAGRMLTFTATIRNAGTEPVSYAYWLKLTRGDPPSDVARIIETQGPWMVTLQPGETIAPTIVRDIPASFPADVYTYTLLVGIYPRLAVSAVSTTIIKRPTDDLYREAVGAENPLQGVDVGNNATPTFVDLDADGDFDLFVGTRLGNVRYFENVGSPFVPSFVERTGAENPLDVNVGGYASPAFGDLDLDGDLDAVVSNKQVHAYYENVGTPGSPQFVFGGYNPFGMSGASSGFRKDPALVDIDGDGDVDFFQGDGESISFGCDGAVHQQLNVAGEDGVPAFELLGVNRIIPGCVGAHMAPTFLDLGGDGDLDAFVGTDAGTVFLYENIGTATQPQMVLRENEYDPLNFVAVPGFARPAAADLDGDGDGDVLVGAADGTFSYFRNDNPAPGAGGSPVATGTLTAAEAAPGFALLQNAPNPFAGATSLTYVLPRAGNVDLSIHDVAGRRVAQLVHGARPAGRHTVRWEPDRLPSGMYFCRLRAGEFRATRLMSLVR